MQTDPALAVDAVQDFQAGRETDSTSPVESGEAIAPQSLSDAVWKVRSSGNIKAQRGSEVRAGPTCRRRSVRRANPPRRSCPHGHPRGYDPVSLTGLIAGGATVIVFTTGRGSVIGARPTPVIKVATNTDLYRKMREDMDLNAGGIIEADETTQSVGTAIFEEILEVASGKKTVSEEMLLGQEEFVPWQLGAVT